MQLDDMKQLWTAYSAELERRVSVNERILREMLVRQVRAALNSYQIVCAVELATAIATVVASIAVLTSHSAEPRYWIVAGGLAVLGGSVAALCALSLHQTTAIDYAQPVTTLRRSVERMRIVEYRALKWSLLMGIVAWLPAVLVGWEVFTGVHALARVNTAWLVANLLFGLVCLVLGQAISRRYLERDDLAPWAHRLVESLSGHAAKTARLRLLELERFERDE